MTSHQWAPPYGAWTYAALGLALAVLLLLAWRLARSPAARSGILLFLRAGVLALLLLVLLNLVGVSETRLPPRPQEVVYLVDCSRSMALDRPRSRLQQVQQAIRQGQAHLPANPPRFSTYRFGEQLAAAGDAAELRPTEDATRLREALERLPAHFTDGPPAAVVIFSDGRTNETADFEELASGYKRLGVPLHVFPVGDRVAGDVAVQDVIAPRDAAPGTRVPVRVVVRSHGYQGRRTEVRIRSVSDPQRQPLATLPITLTDGLSTHELLIDHDPAAGQLVAEVPAQDGEASLENNRVPFQIGARRHKVRVLYMEGTLERGGNEYHFLRDALLEDPDMECVAIEPDNQYADRPTLHRVDDPSRGYPTTREELFSYDVIICSDISRDAFTKEQLDWTVELVHKRGGGFAMVGGYTSFDAGLWQDTVWDGLIPSDMRRGPAMGNIAGRPGVWNGSFRVKVPREAERHPIWRIVDDPERNREILAQMPPFTGTNLIRKLKPAATALGYTDQPIGEVGIMPVFSCETYGKGRTFAMSTDTTYAWGTDFEESWGEAGDNRYFRKFWRNVVGWLAENSGGGNRRLRLETDKVIYRPGQPIQVSARAYDDKLEETGRYRLVARLRPASTRAPAGSAPPAVLQEVPLAPRPKDHVYEGALAPPPLRDVPVAADNPLAGMRLLTLDVAAYDGDAVAAQATLEVQVLDDPEEFQDPQPDPGRLEQLARDSGGKVLHNGEELAKLLGGYGTAPGEVMVQKVPLWDHAALWGLLLALLAAEWVLRRWWGLA
jgi:uncharacterized membrane protein